MTNKSTLVQLPHFRSRKNSPKPIRMKRRGKKKKRTKKGRKHI